MIPPLLQAVGAPQNPNTPSFLFDDLPLDWLMTRWEKYAFSSLLSWLKPDVAIEVGTYHGGSLQVIARHARKVYSLDLIEGPREALSGQMPNVDFRVGDSKTLLPALLAELAAKGEALGFVLVDGDHSTEGVRADLTSLLAWVPTAPVFVVMHDSFNPPCRQGMRETPWAASPHVHYVELDFVPGIFYREGNAAVAPGSMYGGFALALMLPERRQGPLVVGETQRGLYEATLLQSRYVDDAPPAPVRGGTLGALRRKLGLRTRVRRLLQGG